MADTSDTSDRARASSDDSDTLDCVVVGAGPAGLTAALYLQRFQRRLLIVDAGNSRALKITRSNNCPGFPEGIAGRDLIERLEQQLRGCGAGVLRDQVTRARRRDDGSLELALAQSPQPLLARTVLLCTGVEDRLPELPGVAQVCAADRLRQCPICDGYEHRGRHIGVLGDDEHAEREAEFLRSYGESVTVIPLRAQPGVRAARSLAMDEGQVRATLSDGSIERYDVLYAALGVDPRNSLAAQLGAELDARGNVVTDAHGHSSVDGLYAAGDLVSALDQLAVAFGHAAIAATSIHNRLAEVAKVAEVAGKRHRGPGPR